MKRVVALLPVLIAFQAGAPPALAWTWPADGPVLQPFVLGDDPYAAAQHRGVDIAAPLGRLVRAPASGTVSFAGTVPGGGRTMTIETADGYSVTLVHLGSIAVARGQQVAEGAGVGSAGPSGEAEHGEPYVHLGVRQTADPNGYVDPLGLLPERGAPPPASPVPPAEQLPVSPEPPPVPEAPEVPAPAPEAPTPVPVPSNPAPAAPVAVHEPVVSSLRERLGAPGSSGIEQADPANPVSPEPHPAQAPARIERTHERGYEHPAARASTASLQAAPPAPALGDPAGAGRGMSLGAVLTALGLAALGVLALAHRRGDLGGARGADAAPAMLRDGAGRAAEDAPVAGSAEQNRLVADGDLERVALREPEALADLDRDDDPPELVQVPDDAGCRLPSSASRRRFHPVVSRPPRHRRRPARRAARSIR
jgi:murein DD-endopeptidase MepM/ murein hydrolase activator NlpD